MINPYFEPVIYFKVIRRRRKALLFWWESGCIMILHESEYKPYVKHHWKIKDTVGNIFLGTSDGHEIIQATS